MKQDKRFQVVKKESIGFGDSLWIIVDRETGVQYLSTTLNGYAGGLTTLVDRDGKPLLYQEEPQTTSWKGLK